MSRVTYRMMLNGIWEHLSHREQVIARARLGLAGEKKKTTAELAEHFGISAQRIYQIENAIGVKVLRHITMCAEREKEVAQQREAL
jgi:DNA-directed RNA polymerase sigma subunit (sigma70/sigma32)